MWPQCKAGKHLTPIVCGPLIRAVRRESVHGIAHHGGVSVQTVVKWRKALGVAGVQNEGTRQLRVRWSPEVLTEEVRDSARRALQTPEHAAAVGARRRGRKASPETLERMRQAHLGKRASATARANMSAAQIRRAQRERATGIGWQAKWDALLGTIPDEELAARVGVNPQTVYRSRKALGVPSYRRTHGRASDECP
jgi:DNA-binding MurR/RpiR family transcriptional regulator